MKRHCQCLVLTALAAVLCTVSHSQAQTFQLSPIWSKPKPDSRGGFLKNLTIESFGYDSGPQQPGFQFSTAYTASFYNLHQLECPLCVLGPVNRAKFTIPPFGAQVTLKLRDDHIEVFSRAAALEAWKPDGTYEPHGLSLGTSTYGDAWLAQVEGGAKLAVDPGRHVWLGASGRHLVNLGSGPKTWNTVTGSATLVFGNR
ncbi:MAG TPA: hypothetical protein VKU01_10855 [Bryobacteraceae bacterium]|nr:hypothetical protein [Bryobacteraceae bacterium]